MVRQITCFLIAFSLFNAAAASSFEAIDQLNNTNFARYFNGLYNYLYDSRGCLHFTPADIYLLSKTIPPGTRLEIKKYSDVQPPFDYKKTPFFADVANTAKEAQYYKQIFKNHQTRLIVYPALQKLFIFVNEAPYLQVRTQPGPPKEYIMVHKIKKGAPIKWDQTTMTRTDAGEYAIIPSELNYQSYLYYQTTVIPFGEKIIKNGRDWVFKKGEKWHYAPKVIAQDLGRRDNNPAFNYFDVEYNKSGEIAAARWGSHDFGKYTLLWSNGAGGRYPELGYAEGELLYDQILLVKDLAQILTNPASDDFNDCIFLNANFKAYKECYNLVKSKGKEKAESLDPETVLYYKFYYHLPLNKIEASQLDKRIIDAFNAPNKDKKSLGIYNYVKDYALVVEEKARWYQKIKEDWQTWRDLKIKLRADFEKMDVKDAQQQQRLLEKWISLRLEFHLAVPIKGHF